MKRSFLSTLLLLAVLIPLQAQKYYVCGEEDLVRYVSTSEKPYRILFIFCTYCHPVQHNLSLDSLMAQHKSDSIEYFPLTCQSTQEGLPYLMKHGFQTPVYFVNRNKPKKKRWGIFVFENPVSDAVKILARFDDAHTNIGAGGYLILDRENRPILWSDYKKKKFDQSFMELKDFIRKH